MCSKSVDSPIAQVIPINGAAKINIEILKITEELIACQPHAIIAAPANPPIRVCEEDDGIPHHHVSRFQVIAARIPERIIGRVMYCSNTVLDTVLAIPNSPIIYLETM